MGIIATYAKPTAIEQHQDIASAYTNISDPRYANKSYSIRILQEKLKNAGHQITVDGILGPETQGIYNNYIKNVPAMESKSITGQLPATKYVDVSGGVSSPEYSYPTKPLVQPKTLVPRTNAYKSGGKFDITNILAQ